MIPSLARLLEELATRTLGIERAAVAGATEWSRAGRAFAAASPAGVELRLDRAIATAALRTPDVGPSARGPEWVRFNPRELDGHAVDRVTAWFELAHRRAGE